jgi:hypothetical protein
MGTRGQICQRGRLKPWPGETAWQGRMALEQAVKLGGGDREHLPGSPYVRAN